MGRDARSRHRPYRLPCSTPGERSAEERFDQLTVSVQSTHCPRVAPIQSAACTRATRTRLFEPSGLNTDASPSLLPNQFSPNASRMFGLWVTIRVLLPASGTTVAKALSALARRAFSAGETTSPPSVRSGVVVGGFPLTSCAVSVARLNSLE